MAVRRAAAGWNWPTLVTSPENPLTARVFVNRVWQWVFGSGIVSTPNDFGPPGRSTHTPATAGLPAGRLRSKRLVLEAVDSEPGLERDLQAIRAGQCTSHGDGIPSTASGITCPSGAWDAESIRDTLLAVSGRLDRSLFGEPLNPYRKMEDATKRLFSGPLDGDGRRSIYLKMDRHGAFQTASDFQPAETQDSHRTPGTSPTFPLRPWHC